MIWAVVLITFVTALGFIQIAVDTDPENMLAADHPVRVLNAEVKQNFGIGDMIAVGVSDPSGDSDAVSHVHGVVVPQMQDSTTALVTQPGTAVLRSLTRAR